MLLVHCKKNIVVMLKVSLNLYRTVDHQTKRGKIYTIERGKISTLISVKTPFIIKFRHEKVDNK